VKIYQRPHFARRFKKLAAAEQQELCVAAKRLPDVVGKPHLHSGLGLRPFGRYFEFRVKIDLRVLFLVEGGDVHLVTVGTHDEVRAYLKNNS
jgi:hypothetical protein